MQARLKGMTVEEYLDELMNGDVEDCPIESDSEAANQVTEEMSKIVDEVELQWLNPIAEGVALSIPQGGGYANEPTSIIAATIDRIGAAIDRLGNLRLRLLGRYFPQMADVG
jgi:hypothetical protein